MITRKNRPAAGENTGKRRKRHVSASNTMRSDVAAKTKAGSNKEKPVKNKPVAKDKKPKNSAQSKEKSAEMNPSFNFSEFIRSRGFINSMGVFLLIFAIYAFFSVVFFFSSWKADEAFVSDGLSSVFNSDFHPEHPLGRMGAWLGYVLVRRWFGIASLILLIPVFWAALSILKQKPFPWKNTFLYCLLPTVLISSVTGGYSENFSGLFGYQVFSWLKSTLGMAGYVLFSILLVATYVTLVLGYNVFKAVTEMRLRKKQNPVTENEVADYPEPTDDIAENEEDESPGNDASELEFEIYQKEVPEVKEEDEIVTEDEEVVFMFGKTPKKTGADVHEIPVETEMELSTENTNPVTEENKNTTGDVELTIDETGSVLENTALEPDDPESAIEHRDINSPVLDNILEGYTMPPTDFLNEYGGSGDSKVSREELEANKNKIVETLGYYDIKISKIKATIGPTVTLYEIIPEPGVRISKIKNLEDDIALSLAALGIRIIAPIPGKGTIGIEVPNQNKEIVSMRSMLESEKFSGSKAELPFVLGKTITSEAFVADLTKLPHLLIAGATGQGKSVGLNAIITSLLYKKNPAELKFVFVDPKKVELALYSKIDKHYLAKLPGEDEAIITDVRKVIATLTSLTQLMDKRYDLLKNGSVKNIIEYNNKFMARRLNPEDGHHYMPYIVLVIDEFADLIMTAGKEVELPVARIAQLARAVGIHLIIATQRPSVDVITGKIKANFPARIAFRVSSKVDSRTILDINGADQLIGRGDMLFSHGSDLLRIQCAFIDTPEIELLVDYIAAQVGFSGAFELPEPENDQDGEDKVWDSKSKDPLFEDAARIIVSSQQGSTSLLQRKMQIGHNRAGRIMDQLEAAGIVGPPIGSKPREVYFTDILSLEQFLKNLN